MRDWLPMERAGGVRQLTMSRADDWGGYRITVNCLAPGWFQTAQNRVMYESKEWVEYLVERIPLKRPGAPNDLEGPIVFWLLRLAAMTKQTMLINGGIRPGSVPMWAPKRTLGSVAGRAIAGHGVVADKVGLPLHASGIDVDQQRRVGGHDDELAVAFEAGRPGCVAEPSLDGCRFRGSCRWAVRVRRARARRFRGEQR